MATTIAELQARLSANTDDYDRALRRSEDRFGKFGRVIKTGALAAGAAIGTGLAISAKVGFDEFNEGQKVAAQTAAVLKSTGGAANVTAKQIDRMATSLMNKTGIDDEAIKSGSNLLLTFTKIRNETGKGNDIFNQATKTIQDMSVALGQDTKSSAIQLGKALNDPIRGITALRRVGVSFNDAQTETITKLVESGQTMKAQKIILAELHKEFGGSAEAAGKTFAGQMNILKETFTNTAGEIVGRFVPVLVTITKAILPLLLKGINYVVKGLEFMSDVISEIVQGVGFGAFGKRTEDDLGRVGQAAIGVGQVFKRIWAFIQENIIPIILELKAIAVETFRRIAKVIENNRPALNRILERLGALLRFVWTILKPILILVFEVILPRVLTAAIKIIDKVSFAIQRVIDFFRRAAEIAKSTWGRVSNFIGDVRDAIQGAIDKVRSFFQWISNGVKKVTGPLEKLGDLFGALKLGRGGIFSGDGIVSAIGAGPSSISSTLFDDLALANASGLVMTSGYRPGAITSTGNPSLHGVYPAKAIDVAGSEAAMRRFFLMEVARGALTGLREVIHSPYWWHPGSGIQRIPASAGSVLRDHYSHVHVGSYDRGGYLRPGWNLAYNGLGRPESVGGGPTVNVSLGGPVFLRDRSQMQELADIILSFQNRGVRLQPGG